MRITRQQRSVLFAILNILSELYPDLEPLRQDSDEDIMYKYFYWVDEYNEGCDPRNIARPEFI